MSRTLLSRSLYALTTIWVSWDTQHCPLVANEQRARRCSQCSSPHFHLFFPLSSSSAEGRCGWIGPQVAGYRVDKSGQMFILKSVIHANGEDKLHFPFCMHSQALPGLVFWWTSWTWYRGSHSSAWPVQQCSMGPGDKAFQCGSESGSYKV